MPGAILHCGPDALRRMSAPAAGVGPDIPRRPDPGIPTGKTGRQTPDRGDPGAVLPGPNGPAAEELDALVEEILGSKPRPVDWARLTGDAAAEALAVLAAWVGWLARRYAIDPREIPLCWAEHGEFVEELSALHTAHRAAYDHDGSPAGPADWHATLANTRARLHRAASRTGCRAGLHRPSPVPDWAA